MPTREPGIVDSFAPAPGDDAAPDDPEEIIARIFDPERRGALYPLYHRLRTVAPVHRTDHPAMPGVWFVTRFADALDLYKNTSAVSDPATAEHFNHGGEGGPFYALLKAMMLFLESEQHARVRRLVVKAFTPRSIETVRPITQAYADRLLAELGDRREMDIVTEFAYELPLRVIAHLLGVPEADFPTIEQYAFDFARGSEPSTVATDRTRRADAAALGFRDYFEHLIARRRDDRGDDVLSALINAEEEGQRLTHDQVVATSVLLMQAGHETTTDSIGNALVALLRAPDQLALLRDDTGLTRNAVEELFRYDSTNQFNNRLLLDDVTVGGVHIAAGEQVAIVIGAANRDPVQFPDPDTLQLARPTPQHVAFAFGTYYCIGNALARSEVQVALRSLLDHFPTLRPAADTFEWRTTLRNRGPAELRVAW
jgi:pimeloyl-[acyl-carrier protein] synthase